MKNRLGIIGGGQLGRMLAFDAKKMGFHVTVIDPTPQSPAGQVVDEQILAPYDNPKATHELAKKVDFITVEIEHINTDTLADLSKKGHQINPSPQTIEMIKDKFQQKIFLKKNHIPTADFIEVKTEKDIIDAAKKFGYPLLLKAKHGAYDGRGNALIKNPSQITAAWKKFNGKELYVEKFVPFTKELAIMVARSVKGDIATYPVVETVHKNNICHTVFAPAPIKPLIKKKAIQLARQVMKHLKGAGVFGIEMFLAKNEVLVNEIAPRVHNSGHYTIEASVTSQFEQHIRAVCGLPLGKTDMMVKAAVMINILGDKQHPADVRGLEKALNIPGVFVHIYGKGETKPERKMGHITVIDTSLQLAHKKALLARKYISI